ncbi:MAG TPA: hypothetical protein VGK29_27120 [Paludibaculum sp.]|jgi:hypothetical protein
MASASSPSPLVTRRSILFAGFGLLQHHPEVVVLAGIEFQSWGAAGGRRSYLRIHGNEETAREALLAHLAKYPGPALIVNGRRRNVLVAGGALDPNRMFTREGAEKSYRRLNPKWGPAEIEKALNWLDEERPRLLARLLPRKGGLLVSVHNNSEGYSVEDELAISDRTHLPRRDEPHQFFLATAESDFKKLAQGRYNVVLQSGRKGEEDGSLSRTCSRLGVRYVNLEVGAGKLAVQIEMLGFLEKALPE